MDWSFLENAVPKPEELQVEVKSGQANVTLRVDADCMLLCDGEYIEAQLIAGIPLKVQLPVGQHLLQFISTQDNNVRLEKSVDFPESGKNYLVLVNELSQMIAPIMPQGMSVQQIVPPSNPFLDQLNSMASSYGAMTLDGQTTPSCPPLPGEIE